MVGILRAGLVSILCVIGGMAAARTLAPVKVGQSAAAYTADITACETMVRAWPLDAITDLPPPVGGAEPINRFYQFRGQGLLPEWVAFEIDRQDNARLARFCLKGRGYAMVALDRREAAEFAASKDTAGRAAWLEHFSAADLTARIDASRDTLAPLPPAPYAPFAIGALRVDPNSLNLAGGAVAAKGAVVTGKVGHRLTARLQAPFTFLTVRVEPGAEFMAFVAPAPWSDALSPATTTWCTRVKQAAHIGPLSLAMLPNLIWCFRDDEQGYGAYGAGREGGDWLPTTIMTGHWAMSGPIELAIDDKDEIGPLDLVLVVEKVTDKKVTLTAKVTQTGDKPAIVWRGAEAFDPNGRAFLPFWTKSLVLTRDGAGVTARWEAGDGRGWVDQPAK